MNKCTLTLLLIAGFALSSHAAFLVVNDNLGTNTERGVAFDLTNTSTTDTVKLTGEFNLPIVGTASEGYNIWIRTGTVLGNIGDAATGWTDYGTDTQTAQDYTSGSFTLTSYTFSSLADYEIAAGETIGIWLKDANQTASYRYVNGGSASVTETTGFTDGGLQYSGFYGLGTTGNAPNVVNSTFGPTRNFVGEIGYTAIPEPSSLALMVVALGGLAFLRRR